MSFTQEEIVEMWKQDCTINETNLATEITRTPILHAKYLEIYLYAKKQLALNEKRLSKLKALKRRYYKGEMTYDELKKYGWDQYQGLKMSATEFNSVFETDADVRELIEVVDNAKTMCIGMEYIMKEVNARGYHVKTLSEHLRFINGG